MEDRKGKTLLGEIVIFREGNTRSVNKHAYLNDKNRKESKGIGKNWLCI